MQLSERDMNQIFTAVEVATGITPEQLRSDDRQQKILFARYIAIQLLREQNCTMEAIGDTLQRTRQGVSKSLRTHRELLQSDCYYRNTYSTAKLLINLPIQALPPKEGVKSTQMTLSFFVS